MQSCLVSASVGRCPGARRPSPYVDYAVQRVQFRFTPFSSPGIRALPVQLPAVIRSPVAARSAVSPDGAFDVDKLDVDSLQLDDPFGVVEDVMTASSLRCATPDQPLSAAASKLDKVTGLAVVDDNNVVVGVVSIKVSELSYLQAKCDLIRSLIYHGGLCHANCLAFHFQDINRLKKQGIPLSEPVKNHMSTPPIVVREKARIGEAAAIMLARNIHRLPVVDSEGKLIGIVSRTDIFRPLLNPKEDVYQVQTQRHNNQPIYYM